MTSFNILIDRFFHRIETDRDFFNYFNLTDNEAMELANQRAEALLYEATALLSLRTTHDINFADINYKDKCFNFDLTDKEIILVSSFMYQQYLERDIAKLKVLSVNYTSSNLKVFDPSNARSTFRELYEKVCADNDLLLDEYNNKDRETNQFIRIDYGSYEEDI